MRNGHTGAWELPFGAAAELELQTEYGSLTLVPVEADMAPRLELAHGSREHFDVRVDRVGERVRVALDPRHAFNWFGGRECRATLYVPRDIRADIQADAGRVTVEDLVGCELRIRTNAGKIALQNVFGRCHLAADAGSVSGHRVGGSFDVETRAGSVRLEIVDLHPGEHRIRATMGSVRLTLARGMDVCIATYSTLGSVRSTFPSRQGAPARLTLSTEMGSVRIDDGAPSQPWPAPAAAGAAATGATTTTVGERPRPAPVDADVERILKMVEAGQLSARDADDVLRALGRV